MFQAVGFVIVFNSFNSNYSKNSNNSKNSWIWILLKNSKNSATLVSLHVASDDPSVITNKKLIINTSVWAVSSIDQCDKIFWIHQTQFSHFNVGA